MAPPRVQPGGAGEAGPAQQQQGGGGFLQKILTYILIYFVAQQFIGPRKPTDPAQLTSNLFSKGEKVDFWLYVTESEFFNTQGDAGSLIWHEEGIPYSTQDPAASRQLHWTYHPSEAVRNNGSLWGHAFFARSGYSPNPEDATFDRSSTFSKTFRINKYGIKPKVDRRVNLLGKSMNSEAELAQLDRDAATRAEREEAEADLAAEGSVEWTTGARGRDSTSKAEEPEQPWVSFWRPNVTINLVEDHNAYPKGGVPAHLVDLLDLDPASGNFFPPVFVNDFWLLKDYLQPINASATALELDLFLAPLSAWWWNLYVQMEQSFKMQASMGSMGDGEADEIKRVFIEGNPWLLGLTMVVSLFHTVFDFLAFKNDIQFWRNNKSMEGLSARTVIISFVSQVIVLLYLLDNETSWMIIISAAVGCVIEFWKIGKAMDISVGRWGSIPVLVFKDKQSYGQNKTKEYDEQATRYLSYLLFPLVGGYAVWSLFYQTHKSWYSWVVTSLTGAVYTFGFIMMTPQLFINYKLKSVAHLPWRQMTYKFLNTIIDDLFAFVIKMPLLHRLSVFRDDLVFLIFLYQLWIYPVDKKRVNEFGFGGEEALGPPPAELAGQMLAPALPEGEVVSAKDSNIEATSVTRTAAGKVAEAREEVPLVASNKGDKKTK